MIANFMLHYDALFILSNDVTIGESQPVSQANEREQQTQKRSNQQVAGILAEGDLPPKETPLQREERSVLLTVVAAVWVIKKYFGR